MASWEAGGPSALLANTRHNLFTPWLLSQIGQSFGIPFIAFDRKGQKVLLSGNDANFFRLLNFQIAKPKSEKDSAEEVPKSRYDVVRHFGDKIC